MEEFDVRRVTVAFDWTVRRRLQAALDKLSGEANVDDDLARALTARAVVQLLLGAMGAARAAFATTWRLGPEDAPARFDDETQSLRGRYDVETRRNATRRAVQLDPPRPDEGAGYLVVTVLVGGMAGDPQVVQPFRRPGVAEALDRLLPDRGGLIALEVIWSPTEDADRLSPDELRTLYPELMLLDDEQGRPLGLPLGPADEVPA